MAILNPRRIDECLDAFEKLDVAKGWLTGYRESQLRKPFESLLDLGFDPVSVVSDDVVVTRDALDAVLELQADRDYAVATGFCNLDETVHADRVNLSTSALKPGPPSMGSYDVVTRDEVDKTPWRTKFTGMCLTTMSNALWRRFPIEAYGPGPGFSSDYHLSYRLQQHRVPIFAAHKAYVRHLKAQWSLPDPTPGRELYVGRVEPQVWVEA